MSICIGCDGSGGANSLATILSILGAATGVLGTFVGVVGFLRSQDNHEDALFREEFERYRVALETSLQGLKRKVSILRASAAPITPIATLRSNFETERQAVNQLVEALLEEADEIDAREIMQRKWVPKLRPQQLALETAWEVFDDRAPADATLRQAAAAILAGTQTLITDTRAEISGCVRHSARRRLFRSRY